MDELALLRDFRLEDAAADGAREYARAALQTAMTRRRRLPRRRYAIALAFVLAALLAAAAYAIVHEFVIGSAAPKDVQDQVGLHIAISEFGASAFPQTGFTHKPTGPALIAAVARTPVGPVYMLLAPVQGGECQFVWYARQQTPRGLPITSGSCQFGKHPRPRTFGYGFETGATRNSGTYTLIEGYAPGAVRVRIGERFFKTPFGWFIAEWRGPELLTAYGANGRVVKRVMLHLGQTSTRPRPAKPTVPVVPIKGPRVVIKTHTGWVQADVHVTPAGRSFKWLATHEPLEVSVALNNKGGRCIYVDVKTTTLEPGPGCAWKPLHANEIQALVYEFGWVRKQNGPGWVSAVALLGQVGSNVARVDVHFADGSSAPIPLHDAVLFYPVPRANFAVGRRPVEIVGRDASGHIVAHTRPRVR